MLVLLATMSPLTRCADGAYGDFLDSATCRNKHAPLTVLFVHRRNLV